MGLVVLAGCLAGCGNRSSLELAPVSGTVVYRDKALDHGRVVFVPTEGTKGPQAEGEIQPDGSFWMVTPKDKDGAVVGRHVVLVECRRKVSEAEARKMILGEHLIPKRYFTLETSPLRCDVKAGMKNRLDIVLEDEPSAGD
ncbi:MAG: hypothetical protein JW818_21890 [Pirellulales bacterium]|nr:hypothetical protein [Pirellulales bacterium]